MSEQPRRFPIMYINDQRRTITHHIPWDFADEIIRPQAEKNHGQTLERLAERGGLSYMEACLAMMGIGLFTAMQPTQDRSRAMLAGGMHAFDRMKGRERV